MGCWQCRRGIGKLGNMDTMNSTDIPGTKAGTATRRRGRNQAKKIVKAARSILIEEGYAGLTMRKVARRLDISLGNLTYYFAGKDDLLRAVIADLLAEYHEVALREQQRFPDNPHGRFLAYLEFLISDCLNPETRSLFFQIWGMAIHVEIVSQLRDEIYAVARADAVDVIAPLHPDASESEINSLASMFIAMIEGLHVVADLDRELLRLPPDFEQQFRNMAYKLVAGGLDASIGKDVERLLPKKLRRI